MAVTVKVMKRPTREVSYVRAALKGMSLTFKHMRQPSVTMQYPEGPLQVCGVRLVSPDLPGQLHQAGAWRGRERRPLSVDL